MGFFIYCVVAILWGGFTMYRWGEEKISKLDAMDSDELVGAWAVGFFWPATIPFYLMFWSMKGIARKISKELAARNADATD